MKKLLFAVLLLSLSGLCVCCDKDDEKGNPFSGTVWKRRYMTASDDYEYEVYRFYSDTRYDNWTEDANGCVICIHLFDVYRVDVDAMQLILNAGSSSEKSCEYFGNPPGKFVLRWPDTGVEEIYYRQP